jgi:Uri superfamily endonuclease
MNEQIFLKNERDKHYIYFDCKSFQFILVELNSVEHADSTILLNSKIQVYNFGVSESQFKTCLKNFDRFMVESTKEEFTQAYNQDTDILNTLEI